VDAGHRRHVFSLGWADCYRAHAAIV